MPKLQTPQGQGTAQDDLESADRLSHPQCDEVRPSCKKCEAYGMLCNYDLKCSDLQLSANGAIKVETLQASPCSENQTILSIINATPCLPLTDSQGSFNKCQQFSVQDLELLRRFHTRTLLTLGPAQSRHIYQNAYIKLTYSVRHIHSYLSSATDVDQHPFLLHIVLTLTLMHDRHLGVESNVQQSTAIAFHWSQGAALLNNKLSVGVAPSERDALWVCAGLLGALACSSIQASAPEEAWPLEQSSPSDLDWLKMCEGKRAIWKIADPLRADSIFHPIAPDFLRFRITPDSSILELQTLPLELLQLCNIDGASTQENNPYLASAFILAQLINIECNNNNIAMFLCFFGSIHSDYKRLLGQKDPCAMLLLAYWYAKVCQYKHWWIWRRAFLECQAICIYLRLYYGSDGNIMKLLQYPKTLCDQFER